MVTTHALIAVRLIHFSVLSSVISYDDQEYSGTSILHHWTHATCPDYRGVLNSEVPLYRLVTFGTRRVSSL